MSYDYNALKQKVLDAAKRCAVGGPAYAQQRPVFDEVAVALGGGTYTRLDLNIQQAILTCWHDLFREGELSWGYDLDNPDSPFFHIPERTGLRQSARR